MPGLNRTAPGEYLSPDRLNPDGLGVDPPVEKVRFAGARLPTAIGITMPEGVGDCALVAKDEDSCASWSSCASWAASIPAAVPPVVLGADTGAAPAVPPAGAVDCVASGALADESAVGLRKTMVSWAVLAGSLTASWPTNCVAPSSSAEAALDAPDTGETSPRKMYPRSPGVPMISTSVPVSSNGVAVPSPVTWALNHGSAEEAHAFVVMVTSIGLAAAEPNELSEAAVENWTTGLRVGNGTEAELAAETAALSPRYAALGVPPMGAGTGHPVAAAAPTGVDPPVLVSAGVPALTHP